MAEPIGIAAGGARGIHLIRLVNVLHVQKVGKTPCVLVQSFLLDAANGLNMSTGIVTLMRILKKNLKRVLRRFL